MSYKNYPPLQIFQTIQFAPQVILAKYSTKHNIQRHNPWGKKCLKVKDLSFMRLGNIRNYKLRNNTNHMYGS